MSNKRIAILKWLGIAIATGVLGWLILRILLPPKEIVSILKWLGLTAAGAAVATVVGWLFLRILSPKRERFPGVSKPLSQITPQDFGVAKPPDIRLTEAEYLSTYVERHQDKEIEDCLSSRLPFIVLGKPTAGKTRLLFQHLNSHEGLEDSWLLKPDAVPAVQGVPKKKRMMVFFDDLNKFANIDFPMDRFLREIGEEKIIIATCRSGDELKEAETKFSKLLYELKHIELPDISDEEGQKLAQTTGGNFADFDGTPGSILLGLGEMRRRVEALSDEGKAILWSLKLLAYGYIYPCPESVVRGVYETCFGAAKIRFDSALTHLKDNGLVTARQRTLSLWHDKYFELIDKELDVNDLKGLRPLLLAQLRQGWCLVNLGVRFSMEKDLDGAIKCYDQAIELDPKLASAYYNRGTAYARKGEQDRAILDFDQAIELGPKDASAYNNRGTAYARKGEQDRAIQDFDQAIELGPKDASAYNNRGTAYARKGEQDRAIQDYDQAIELDPKYASAYNNRGTAYARKGEQDRAIQDYDQAIELDPKYASAMANKGLAYVQKGDADKARHWLGLALER